METMQIQVLTPRTEGALSLQFEFGSLEINITAVEKELRFYDQLLTWVYCNCKNGNKRKVELLRGELKMLLEQKLSVCLDGLKKLQAAAKSNKQPVELNSDFGRLQLYFNHISDGAQTLKSKIQDAFPSLVQVRIW